jgi:hypothetical protein
MTICMTIHMNNETTYRVIVTKPGQWSRVCGRIVGAGTVTIATGLSETDAIKLVNKSKRFRHYEAE